MAAAIHAYYDGSGNSRSTGDQFLTLAGYAGPPEAWTTFDARWQAVLADWSVPYLHMTEANALKGEFSKAKGWTPQKVNGLLKDLFNKCLSPAGWGEFMGKFVGAACTVNLPDYQRASSDLPRLQQKEPEAICVDYVVSIALMTLPEDLTAPHGKSGTVALCFDRNEPFRHKIHRIWTSKTKPAVLNLVSNISAAEAKSTPGLQAADLLAWNTNRYRVKGFEAAPFAGTIRVLAAPSYEGYFDYERLVKDYGGES